MKKINYSLEEFLKLQYKFIVTPYKDEEHNEEGFIITSPELNGIEVFGETLEEAHEEFREAKIAWYEMKCNLGEDIDPPKVGITSSGRLTVRLPKTLHFKVEEFAKEEGVSLNTGFIQLVNEGLTGINNKTIMNKLCKMEETFKKPTYIKFVSDHNQTQEITFGRRTKIHDSAMFESSSWDLDFVGLGVGQ
ncbi:toxin-antitoxin system HicB family antitoxin [Lysinibacillus sphaericus]|uniref:toxin-antitoxin system HicB family antitoxin n=1 Tax=Lysinibacillus sphaericus TaxID=1421 RepID=UPI00248AD067|nr:toxin-antitoxin system HicB family antitoxin [Lysinibacillus sphaericus]